MQMHVLGCKRVKGVAKASGNDFDMNMLIVRVPIETRKPTEKSKLLVDGAGYETADVEMAPEALPAFLALQGKYPLDLELLMDQRFFMGQFKTFVVGHGQQQPLKKVG
jgi:hypothetical protein